MSANTGYTYQSNNKTVSYRVVGSSKPVTRSGVKSVANQNISMKAQGAVVAGVPGYAVARRISSNNVRRNFGPNAALRRRVTSPTRSGGRRVTDRRVAGSRKGTGKRVYKRDARGRFS